jgi:hypothetical protein
MGVGLKDSFWRAADDKARGCYSRASVRNCEPPGTLQAHRINVTKKTVEDLKVLRAELARQMAREAYDLTKGSNQRGLARLGTLSEAIYALDDLIAEGIGEP